MTTPPVPPREPTVHELHGVRRTDDYAWMRDAERLLPHLVAERAYYEAATEHLHHLRGELVTEMSGRVPVTDWSVSWRRGAYVYCTRTDEGNEYTRYLRRPLPTAESEPWQVVLDENALAADHFELGLFEVSPSGRVLAYSVDTSGDELYTLRFRSLDSGEDLPDVIERTYYSGAWSADDSTFFYTVPDPQYRPYQVWRHALGTPPDDDVLVWQEDDQQYELTVDATRSGEWIVIATANRTTSEVWVVPTASPSAPAELLWPRRTGVECEVDHAPGPAGGDWLAVSNDGAVEFQLLSRPLAGGSWSTRVAESAHRLVAVHALRAHVVLEYRRDAAPMLAVLGSEGAVELRPDGPAGSIRLSRLESVDVETLNVVTESLTQPPSWWSVDLTTGARTLLKTRPAPGHDPSAYVEERRWLPSADGVPVPVTVARRSDVRLDGTAPCLLYGYGAYESCLWPEWDAALPSLLDRGVVYAVAHIRGGGEGGRRWWLDGHLAAKQNTFTDHLAVADGLAAGLVDSSRLATRGLSAGGLLQGAVFSQRPDRWRAVVAEVPFVDVVTTMLDASIPLTANEWDEWGDPRQVDEFA
ncbi:MAG: prolyl oligopeptidase family serine peptidase, partial [Geodermatophilaceae bacterium]